MNPQNRIESHFTHWRKWSRFLNKGFEEGEILTPKKDLMFDFIESNKPKDTQTPEERHTR